MTTPDLPWSRQEPGVALPRVLRPPFTDRRSYIHGADLFDCLVQATAAEGMARLRFVRLSDRPVELLFGDADHGSAMPCGYFDIAPAGEASHRRSGWLREVAADSITERLPLMDATILAGANYQGETVSARCDPRFSPMKTAIVLGVALLEKTMPNDVLNLGEIEAYRPMRRGTEVAVRLTRRVAKFIVMSVSLDGEPFCRFTLAATPYVEDPTP